VTEEQQLSYAYSDLVDATSWLSISDASALLDTNFRAHIHKVAEG